MSRLQGKTAIVTGSTRGIGEGIAYRFAAEGANVVVTGRSEERGKQVVHRIEAAGGTAIYIEADVSQERSVERLVDQAVGSFGRLDILVNNAAATDLMAFASKPLADCTTEELNSQLQVTVHGSFWCTKYALPHLVSTGSGSIISISSQAAIRAFPNCAAYSAAKGALSAMTRQVNADYGKQGVRANTIVIGVIINEMTSEVLGTPEMKRSMAELHLSSRLGENEDAAELACYLASDRSRFVVATEIILDGGLTGKGPLPREVIIAGISGDRQAASGGPAGAGRGE